MTLQSFNCQEKMIHKIKPRNKTYNALVSFKSFKFFNGLNMDPSLFTKYLLSSYNMEGISPSIGDTVVKKTDRFLYFNRNKLYRYKYLYNLIFHL